MITIDRIGNVIKLILPSVLDKDECIDVIANMLACQGMCHIDQVDHVVLVMVVEYIMNKENMILKHES